MSNEHGYHTHHPDHASHEHHADADTHGQAMHHGHPHSVLDEDHQVHGHGEHAGHSTAMFRERFWWSLILSIPVVIFSPMVAHLLGYPLPAFPGSTWIPPVLDTIIFVYGGTPFLKGGWKEVKSRQPGMMLLIAMAITVAFVASWVTTLGLGGFDLDFWWELALLVTIMLLGHWLEMRALGGASSALDALAALLPDEAEKVIDGTTRTVDISELVVGDVVLVRAGARVPADGTILEGAAEFDEGMITGESRPVFRNTGDMVADAQESSSRAQALADRAAALLFWFALISALITAVVWTIIGSPDDAVVRTVTVLVIACPHALGLAIPLVIAISTERAAKSGVLIKDRMALERMRTIDVVLFDKTGTLTEGAHAVTGVAATVGVTEGELLALAASGRGVRATVDGAEILVGGPNMLREFNLTTPAELTDTTSAWTGRGAGVLHIVRDGQIIGAVAVEDKIRPESRAAVKALQDRGVKVAMITGDAQQVAHAVGQDLGIDEVFAEVLPQDKDTKVTQLQERGLSVAMVGDGVNDAPALARAEVGIAIGAGTDVAMESAGVVLASDDPRAILSMIELSQASYRKMIQNLIWASGYNILSVPLAAGVRASSGILLPPAAAAVLMSLSTIVVALNAQLLRRIDLDPARLAPTSPKEEHATPTPASTDVH